MEIKEKRKEGLKMALFTFSGGVHPDDGKEYAKNSPITEYLPKGDVVLPVGQHIGAPAKPIVQKGDQVLAGQKIAAFAWRYRSSSVPGSSLRLWRQLSQLWHCSRA